MVRLQKIMYEKVVNTAALGRARTITTPAKWNTVSPYEHNKIAGRKFYNTFFGRMMKPFFRLFRIKEHALQREYMLDMGLTPQDKFLHHDDDLRRSVFFEHMARESLHPYHWVLKMRRRQRYFKVNRALRGFIVPQFIRNEAMTQTFWDKNRLEDEWKAFMHHHYFSDMTPFARKTTIEPKIVIDYLINYGIWRPEAWERFFFNSRDQSILEEKQLKIARNPQKFPYDLTTASGRQQFEAQINDAVQTRPGSVVPEGQTFDFKQYYRKIGLKI